MCKRATHLGITAIVIVVLAVSGMLLGQSAPLNAQVRTGAPAGEALADNPKAWCGDHAASDVKETPGALLSNAKIRHEDPALVDLASTILGLFDAPVSGPGRPLLG